MILDAPFPPDPRVENEAVSLVKGGHNVFLFCLHYGDKEEDEIVNTIQVKRYKSNKLLYKLSALAYTFPFYTMCMKRKIKHFLVQNKIEAIHIHDIRIAAAVFKANKKLKLKTVLDLHDNMPEIMKWYPHVQKFPGKYLIFPSVWKRKERTFVRKADKVVTVSQEFIDEVKSRIPFKENKIVLVPNTVRKSFYKKAIINSSIIKKYTSNFVLLYLGDTGLRRGLLTAITAIPLLKNNIPNIKLVIVGSNTTDAVLKEKVASLGIEKYVDFQGWQNVALFPSYIATSNICISPLNRNIQHDVAYANKLFQYMSFSKPLLVSNATAQKKLVNKVQCGLVHAEKNAADFAEKTLELHKNSTMCTTFGVNGKQFIENEFCWEKTSQNLLQLYTQLKN